MQEIVLATQNQGKKKEFERLLDGLPVVLKILADFPELADVEENGETFAENAYKKASEIAQQTGLLTIADDSGLEVDFLDGAPGIYSARFSGSERDDEANNQLLLEKLVGVPMEKRTARFRCVLAIVTPTGEAHYCQGMIEGKIIEERQGTGGFGYDPLFFVPEIQKTMAELSMVEKNAISHRGQATRSAVEILYALCAGE